MTAAVGRGPVTARRSWRTRRLQAMPVPVALDLIAGGDSGRLPRTDLEPVVTSMVLTWAHPSTADKFARHAPAAVARVFDWLDGQPGDTWTERWQLAGADQHPRDWHTLTVPGISMPTGPASTGPASTGPASTGPASTGPASTGPVSLGRVATRAGEAAGRHEIDATQLTVNALVILGALQPGLAWLVGAIRLRLQDDWTMHHDQALFARIRGDAAAPGARVLAETLTHLFRLSVLSGRRLEGLTGKDFADYRAALLALGRHDVSLGAAWRALHSVGLAQGEPAELSHVLAKAALTPTGLVDRYGVQDPQVRSLLIDYLTEREPGCDYTTLTTVALHLVKLFWVDVEAHHPGIASLALSAEQARDWKRRLQTLPDCRPRRDWPSVAQTVRSFYLDLAAWAQDDPARWAVWVAPSPIGNRELRALAPRRRRRQIAEMNARTRTLSPVLPQLVAAVTERWRHAEDVLTAASAARPGTSFKVAGEDWSVPAPAPRPTPHPRGDVIAVDPAGRTVDVTKTEDRAFWTWAAVEVLRHTGIRVEELLELTHLSLRPFRKPDGQIIPLLQIAPSKTDAERVLPVGPDLAHVLSRIVRRHLRDAVLHPRGDEPDDTRDDTDLDAVTPRGEPTVPVVSRWDEHERVHSPALPFLFQRHFLNGRRSVISSGTIRNWLAAAARDARLRDVDGTDLAFTPHDFRRVFLTDTVRAGLPIHIAAQLAGHTSLETTRRYAATYPIDVIEHYQRFLDRRRAERPVEEYRQPSPAELTAFGEHFGKRRVELGNCVRPYNTGCTHEHACIRCTFLHVDTKQARRLAEIETDLTVRIDTATQQSWLGDVEQLRMTLNHLHNKQRQIQELLNDLPGNDPDIPLITTAPMLVL